MAPDSRLSDQLVKKIRQLVDDEQLGPGDRLPSERVLAERFQVSRPPLREAIRTLASQGLLITRRGGGTYLQAEALDWPEQSMAPLAELINADPHYRYDILEARHALEKATAWHAALRATPKDKDAIQRCFDIMIAHQQKGEATRSAHADARFHLAIAQASHNLVLLQVMRALFGMVLSTVEENRRTMFRLNDPVILDQLTQQHQALVDAIMDGDPRAASTVMTRHLEFVQLNVRMADDDDARRQRASRLPFEETLP